MSDPNQHLDDDELDLDAETVRDLEPNEESAEEVRGGFNTRFCGYTAALKCGVQT
jgi:hypothetical protein